MRLRSLTLLICIVFLGLAGCDSGGGSNNPAEEGQGNEATTPPEIFETPSEETLSTVQVSESNSPMPDMHGVMARPDSTTNMYLLIPNTREAALEIELYDGIPNLEANLAGGSAFRFYGGDLKNAIAIFGVGNISEFTAMECELDSSGCEVLPIGMTDEGDVHIRIKPNKFYFAHFQR